MSEQRCGTCKHWGHPLEGWGSVITLDWQRDRDFDAQDALEVAYRALYGECQMVVFGPTEKEYPTPKSAPLAVVADGSGYTASLTTRAEFGCTEWEAS